MVIPSGWVFAIPSETFGKPEPVGLRQSSMPTELTSLACVIRALKVIVDNFCTYFVKLTIIELYEIHRFDPRKHAEALEPKGLQSRLK